MAKKSLLQTARDEGLLSKGSQQEPVNPRTPSEKLRSIDEAYEEGRAPAKAPKNPLLDPDVMGDAEEAARELGIKLDKTRSSVRETHQFWPFLLKCAKQIDAIRFSPKWGATDPKERQALIVLRTFIRQLTGEKVPQGEYATVRQALAAASDTILGDTTHLSRYTTE